jgi:predicted  nucleic acid-binding Zn-ribbon protein
VVFSSFENANEFQEYLAEHHGAKHLAIRRAVIPYANNPTKELQSLQQALEDTREQANSYQEQLRRKERAVTRLHGIQVQPSIEGADEGAICITTEPTRYELEVFECQACGFHVGIDGSYLIQAGGVKMRCPSCGAALTMAGAE